MAMVFMAPRPGFLDFRTAPPPTSRMRPRIVHYLPLPVFARVFDSPVTLHARIAFISE